MKHLFVEQPPAGLLLAGHTLEIKECADADDLDLPGRIYLGSTDDQGNPTTALMEGMSASLGAIRGPFFKATLADGLQDDAVVPCVVNTDNVFLCLKGADGKAHILAHGGFRFVLAEPYEQIADELFGVMDVDDADVKPGGTA